MNAFFKKLPKITNVHIHLFALYPYDRLLKIIKDIDPELYDKIYILKNNISETIVDVNTNINPILKKNKRYLKMYNLLKNSYLSNENINMDDLINIYSISSATNQQGGKDSDDTKKQSDHKFDEEIETIKNIISKSEEKNLFKYTLAIFNEKVEGYPCENNITNLNDWIKLSEYQGNLKDKLIVTENMKNQFSEFEKIQAISRMFVRHYKVYYYMWYSSLHANYQNNVFYLNVRSKPGSINKDVKCGQRLYIVSKNIMNHETFEKKIYELSKEDRDIKPSDYKYMYSQYTRIKYESDLIMKAVYDFNSTQQNPHFVSDAYLTEDEIKIDFKEKYINFLPAKKQTNPQMMVQYIITFPKKSKNVDLELQAYMLSLKITLYVAVVINNEYNFNFFNGFDLVGNEQESHELSKYIPVINKLLYFRRFGINFYPHIGETNVINNEITPIQQYIFDKNINRVGHGISFTSPGVLEYMNVYNKIIYIESCPISNYLLGYYDPKDHPHRLVVNNPRIKLIICSDDNGIFNYTTVTYDYIFIYLYWNLTLKEIKKLIVNGINVIPQKYKQYYFGVFNTLWNDGKYDEYPDRPFNNSK
jgi:adenosine deaminase